MKLRIKIKNSECEYLSQMAAEGGITVEFLCEVAVYNLIALWMRDRGINIEPSEAAPAGVGVADTVD